MADEKRKTTELKAAAKMALEAMDTQEWCVDESFNPFCDWCQAKTRAKSPGRKHHLENCPWVRVTDALREALKE